MELLERRTVDVHVTWLRDKLSTATAVVQTVRGVGYKLVVPDVPLGAATK